MEEIEYEFEIEVPVGAPDYFTGDTDWTTETITVVYSVEKEEVKAFLCDLLNADEQFVEENYDELWNKHYYDIKDNFESDARNYGVIQYGLKKDKSRVI